MDSTEISLLMLVYLAISFPAGAVILEPILAAKANIPS